MTRCKLSSASTLACLTGLALVALTGLALASSIHSPWGVVQLFFSSLFVSLALAWPMVAPFRYGKLVLRIRLTG
ncbi:hypothetical protein SAMN04244572_02574 [Azotobacter beijerinckii]|uniref:Uncharacterized protein n=1 Tax=Azotobacter beijerinckii TaxID=170623 RepID=A0A1H6VUF5_9GAMM|nr:hypothetical protein SAMN04244572_02574 [Azotobacter beijerinckii]SEJ11217.1 hypothetical protein SAMN04244579_03164 [Azotobacter beijerinckii]